MASYVTYGGNLALRQPYNIEQVSGFGFALRGDRQKMQALCDRTLNLGDKVQYKVLSSLVLFTFMRMDRLRSTLPADLQKGSYRENELNITMLLAAGNKEGIVFIPERLVWYMPYLWLDSGPALIAGREVYGYPKQYGDITIPAGVGEPALFSARGEVFHTFSPSTRSSIQTIVSARRTDAPNLATANVWQTIEEGFAGLMAELLETDLTAVLEAAFVSALTRQSLMNLVFLRQFPSISDGSKACYQSISETSFDVTRYGSSGLLAGQYEVEILKHDSAPIAQELGFAATDSSGNARCPAELSYFLDLDFRLNNGSEIWRAP